MTDWTSIIVIILLAPGLLLLVGVVASFGYLNLKRRSGDLKNGRDV